MDFFIKEYENKIEAIKIFKRYEYLFNSIKNQSYFYMPKPIKIFGKKIYFQKIKGTFYFTEAIHYLNKFEVIHKVGFALGIFHIKCKRGNIFNEIDVILHGDFCPGNIFFDAENKLWFIDAERPNWEGFKEKFIGSIYDDIGKFLYFRFCMYNVYRLDLIFFKSKSKEFNFFINGYQEATRIFLDKKILKNKIYEYIIIEKKFILNIQIKKEFKFYRLPRYFILYILQLNYDRIFSKL